MAPDLVLTGAAIMDAAGSFETGLELVVSEGIIRELGRSVDYPRDARVIDLAGQWLMPGVYDCHSHVFWNQFHAADRESLPLTYRTAASARSLEATLRAGVTTVRDAGGADAGLRDALRDSLFAGPRLAISIDIISGETVEGVEGIRRRVRELLAQGAQWIKLAATGGVMAPEGAELESTLSAEQLRAAVEEATAGGARVMVHSWGGQSVTDSIVAGVASIEHAIFLTEEQARHAASADVSIVPTLTVYSEVHELALSGALPKYVAERTARVVRAHPEAVRIARHAGVRIALGSDFASPAQHGRNLVEIASLAEAGLGLEAALVAATQSGAELLGDDDRGRLAVGAVFDAIALRHEPTTHAFRRSDLVSSVFQRGAQNITP